MTITGPQILQDYLSLLNRIIQRLGLFTLSKYLCCLLQIKPSKALYFGWEVMPSANISQLRIKWTKKSVCKMLLMFLFQHNLYVVFREQQDRCSPTCGVGASLPFKSSIVNRWKVCKQMTGAITMRNWLGSQLLKAHRLHYSFYAALWWQKTWIAHQDDNMFVFSISHQKGTSPTVVEALEREWVGTMLSGNGLTRIPHPTVAVTS